MNTKRFSISFLICILVILLSVATVMIVIDPLFHYHAPLPGISYELNDERYQNDGITKHFTYDALTTGTSMTDNIMTSEIDDLFGVNSIKVSFMGGSYSEIDSNIRTAFRYNPDLKLVIRATDQFDLVKTADFHISTDPDRNYDYPWYIYDDNILNDVKYLFNKALMSDLVTDLLRTKAHIPSTTFDEYANWGATYTFSKDTVLSSFARPAMSETEEVFDKEARELVHDNITLNVINTALEHPNTNFYIWIPPYSIAYYDVENRHGTLAKSMDAMEYELELLTAIDNIHVFCYADEYDIVTNLDNYKDIQHFSPAINSYIIKAMSEGKGLITADNYSDYMKNVREFYLNYDYDSIY